MASLTYSRFKAVLDNYIKLISYQQRMSTWLDGSMPSYEYLMGDISGYHLQGEREISSLNIPFIQKILVPPGSHIIMIGDIHGDLAALEAILDQLKRQELLDGPGKFLRSDCYIVCVGDYGNRHPHSIEVIERLCTLTMDNPGQVFLVRGNHEYALTNRLFRLRVRGARARGEAYPAQTTLLDEFESSFPGYTYPDLLYWYDYLPSLFFIGSTLKTGKRNYVQACHAGLELGWSPKRFLAEESVGFERLVGLDRQEALDRIGHYFDTSQAGIHTDSFSAQLEKSLEALKGHKDQAYFATLYEHPKPLDLLNEVHGPFDYRLGWLWNNFLAEHQAGRAPLVAASGTQRSLLLGQELTAYLLDQAESPEAKIVTIIRGHQHCDETIEDQGIVNNFLTDIRAHKGMIRQWGGLVYTLGATESVSHCYSFIKIKTATQPDWVVEHWYREVRDEVWSCSQGLLRD